MSKWVHVEGQDILPPIYEKRVGRPPKVRRKAPYEVQGRTRPKLSKHGVQMHCTHYKGVGHNRATCEVRKVGLPPEVQNRGQPNIQEGSQDHNFEDVPSARTKSSPRLYSCPLCVIMHT
jgi:hypothetical protein